MMSMEYPIIRICQATKNDSTMICAVDPNQREKEINHAILNSTCYIAKSHDAIIGFALLNYNFFSCGFVELLIVKDGYRRQGVGAALLNHLYAICQTEKLFTSTNESNLPMQGLLNKTGFARCGQIDALDEGDPEVFYYKKRAAK